MQYTKELFHYVPTICILLVSTPLVCMPLYGPSTLKIGNEEETFRARAGCNNPFCTPINLIAAPLTFNFGIGDRVTSTAQYVSRKGQSAVDPYNPLLQFQLLMFPFGIHYSLKAIGVHLTTNARSLVFCWQSSLEIMAQILIFLEVYFREDCQNC